MAASPVAMTPPPSAGGDAGGPASPAEVNPTTPPAASPAPPVPSPAMQNGTQLAIRVVSDLRSIAKAFPATSSKVAEINNLMREVVAGMMQSAPTGEPAAPPSNG
jgi:hypothetical protein